MSAEGPAPRNHFTHLCHHRLRTFDDVAVRVTQYFVSPKLRRPIASVILRALERFVVDLSIGLHIDEALDKHIHPANPFYLDLCLNAQAGPPKLLPRESLEEGVSTGFDCFQYSPGWTIPPSSKSFQKEVEREPLLHGRLNHHQRFEFWKAPERMEQHVGGRSHMASRFGWPPRLSVNDGSS